MLSANRDLIVAGARKEAVELRKHELDVLTERFGAMIGVASITAGFAFSGIIEFEPPETDAYDGLLGVFYAAAGLALSAGLYVVAVGTLLINAGNRLALSGDGHRSVDRAVAVLRKSFRTVLFAGGVSVASMLIAAAAVVFVKAASVGEDHAVSSTIAAIVLASLVFTFVHGATLMRKLRVVHQVHGDVVVSADGQQVNLEDLSVRTGGPVDAHSVSETG